MDFNKEAIIPEKVVPLSRNEVIRQAHLEGKIPMLPFERHQYETELLGHRATQTELGRLMSEAMTTTSETWHDNAQADAVTMQSNILVKQAEGTLAALKNGVPLPYESEQKNNVSIGALVNILIGSSAQTVFITGRQRSLPDNVRAIVGGNTMVINIQSPIGAAIFDKSAGSVVSYNANGRDLQVTVISIEYPDFESI